MSRVCQITGKRPMVGNHVSHSHKKTNRKFYPNLLKKRFFHPEKKQWVTLRVSAKGLRIINKKGLATALKEAKAKGYITKY